MSAPPGYDKYAHEPFAVTVDLAVLTVAEGALHALLVERGQEPYAGHWALPGGFLHPDESAETAARRELAEETGLSDLSGLHLEQLRTYSEPGRDPRMRVVSVAFAALLPDPPEPHGGGDAAEAKTIEEIALAENIDPKLAFELVRVESGFNQRAVSPVGALGYTQLMPETAKLLVPGITRERIFDRETNLRLGFRFLRSMVNHYHGDIRLALLAYNRGPARVDQLLAAGIDPANGYTKLVLGK